MSKVKGPEFEVGYVDVGKPGAFKELLSEEMEERIVQEEGLYMIGLSSGHFAAGVLAFAAVEEHLEILFLYVAPEFRNLGGARLLLEAVETIAMKLERWVSVSFSVINEETKALETLFDHAGYGLRHAPDLKTYVVTLADCEASDNLTQAKTDTNIKYFSEFTEVKLNRFSKQAESKAAPLPAGGLTAQQVDREISVLYEEGGRVKAFVAVENMEAEQGIRLAAAYNSSDNPVIFMWMVKAAFLVAKEKYDKNAQLLIDVVDETADRYVRYVLPEVKEVSRTYDMVPEPA